MPAFPTMEWVLEWVRLANDSEEFQVGGLGWAGAACLVVRQKPGCPHHGTYIRLTGRDGHWSQQILGADPDLATGARIVLDASHPVWKRVIRQELSPMRAILQGSMTVRGHLPDLLKYRSTITTLCILAGQIDTQFVDD